MIEIRKKLKVSRAAYQVATKGELKLPFDLRQKTRLHTKLASGEEVGLMLPRGEVLRGGDLVVASDGRIIEVVAEAEDVLHVTCDTPEDLLRAAYHLGNRHVPVQVGEGFLRLAADHVLEDMLKGLGATTASMHAPFEPEAGAYGGEHHHEEGGSKPGRIHQYGEPQDAGHEHVHGPDCGHDHGHGRQPEHATHDHSDHAHAGHDHDDHAHGAHGHGEHGHDHKHATDHDHDHHDCGHDHGHGHKH